MQASQNNYRFKHSLMASSSSIFTHLYFSFYRSFYKKVNQLEDEDVFHAEEKKPTILS